MSQTFFKWAGCAGILSAASFPACGIDQGPRLDVGSADSEATFNGGNGGGVPSGGSESDGVGGVLGGGGAANGGTPGLGGIGGSPVSSGGGGELPLGGQGGEAAGGMTGSGGSEESCCGCLCADELWSCSEDTCLDDAGQVVGLASEAGFFEFPGTLYISEGVERKSPRHRVWYSFQPADETPENKPLAVLFNGGPGSSTTVLYAFNTGPLTLDPAVVGAAPFSINPHSWTSFANLLYIDAPATGFSYALTDPLVDRPTVGIDLDRDASTVLRLVLHFLERHPALETNPVILVGESYGGTRATLMLHHLFNYSGLTSDSSPYQDAELYTEIFHHFSRTFPDEAPDDVPPERIAEQFGHQVLIQPVVGAQAQWDLNVPDDSSCISDYDSYQCDELGGWFNGTIDEVAAELLDLNTLNATLNVDTTTIQWLYASERKEAYGRVGVPVPADDLEGVFGELAQGDRYYLTRNFDVSEGYEIDSRWWTDPLIGEQFLNNLRFTRSFITNSLLDMQVWMPALVPALLTYESSVSDVRYEFLEDEEVERPGWIEVDLLEDLRGPAETREIRFPPYATAGHAITMKAPAEFLADVRAWYEEEELAPSASKIDSGTPRQREAHAGVPQQKAAHTPPPSKASSGRVLLGP